VNSQAYMILEHFADNSEETVLANTGMLLWSGMHDRYKQVGIGWSTNSDISWAYHGNRGWTYPNLVDYMENHDQERVMFEGLSFGNAAGSYNIKDTATALNHMQMAAALFLGIPGPKMVWQFGELGYDYSIMFNGERTAPKPPRWDYFSQAERQQLYHVYSGMAKLRKNDAFRFGSFTSDLAGSGKRMWISHNSMNVVIAGNMDVNGFDMAPGFQGAGQWYDYFSGETVTVNDPAGHTFYFAPGDFRVFTSVKLPKPFYNVTLIVKDSLTGAVIPNAEILLNGAGVSRTDSQGKATFLAGLGTSTLQVMKSGYKPWKKSQNFESDLEITALISPYASGIEHNDPANGIRIFPNPAGNTVTIESPAVCQVVLYSADGRPVKRLTMQKLTETLDLTGISQGIYFLRFTGKNGNATTLKLVRSHLQ
jgi:hypothetical protein